VTTDPEENPAMPSYLSPRPEHPGLPVTHPADLFLSQLELIEKTARFICRRRGWAGEDAADFCSHVMVKLIEDDYAVLRKFEGRSSLRTYLTTVIHRMFLDYRIARLGKWRSSAQARRMGPAAVHLEKLLNRDGYSLGEATLFLREVHPEIREDEVYRWAVELPQHTPRRFEGEEILQDLAAPGPRPDAAAIERQSRAVRQRAEAILRQSVAGLPEPERSILRMRFEDGTPVVQIARSLGLDQKGLYRQIEAVLKRLRRTLLRQGLRPEHVLKMAVD
jgi:RNA polymerase sigma factor for flagellar operon FliA